MAFHGQSLHVVWIPRAALTAVAGIVRWARGWPASSWTGTLGHLYLMPAGIQGDPPSGDPPEVPPEVPPVPQEPSHGHIVPPHGIGHGVGVGLGVGAGVVLDVGGAWGGVQVCPPNVNVASAFCLQVHVLSAVGAIIPIA